MTKPGKKAAKRLPPRPPVIDPYLPQNGNYGYRVSRYELDLEYKVAINRLTGTANITAVTLATIKEFTLDLADTLGVSKVTVNGRRPTHFGHRAGKITIKLASAIPRVPR
ncbi:Probable peptidase M1%2C membrane alanine aminopeptidase [Mycobacteroides abscessus]|nr:Probable peptidase M1%2C membrane alanine aminopeptidase [Mycobacteroides abscessus]